MIFREESLEKIYKCLTGNDELVAKLLSNNYLESTNNLREKYAENLVLGMQIKILADNKEAMYNLSQVLLDNEDYIKSETIANLIKSKYLYASIAECFGYEVLTDETYKYIYYAFKYCVVSSFFQNNAKKFIPEYDYTKIKDSKITSAFVDALMKEFDKLDATISECTSYLDFNTIPYDKISYLTQLLGFDKKDIHSTTEKEYRELCSCMIDIFRIKGTNYSFELLFSFLGFDITISEYYFDRRFFYNRNGGNTETEVSSNIKSEYYLTVNNPILNKCDNFTNPEIVTSKDITTQYSLLEFNSLAETYGAEAVLGYSPIDKNNNVYTGKVYKYFKSNYVYYKINTTTGKNLTSAQITTINKYLDFLTPAFITKQLVTTVITGDPSEIEKIKFDGDGETDDNGNLIHPTTSFQMLDSEIWDRTNQNLYTIAGIGDLSKYIVKQKGNNWIGGLSEGAGPDTEVYYNSLLENYFRQPVGVMDIFIGTNKYLGLGAKGDYQLSRKLYAYVVRENQNDQTEGLGKVLSYHWSNVGAGANSWSSSFNETSYTNKGNKKDLMGTSSSVKNQIKDANAYYNVDYCVSSSSELSAKLSELDTALNPVKIENLAFNKVLEKKLDTMNVLNVYKTCDNFINEGYKIANIDMSKIKYFEKNIDFFYDSAFSKTKDTAYSYLTTYYYKNDYDSYSVYQLSPKNLGLYELKYVEVAANEAFDSTEIYYIKSGDEYVKTSITAFDENKVYYIRSYLLTTDTSYFTYDSGSITSSHKTYYVIESGNVTEYVPNPSEIGLYVYNSDFLSQLPGDLSLNDFTKLSAVSNYYKKYTDETKALAKKLFYGCYVVAYDSTSIYLYRWSVPIVNSEVGILPSVYNNGTYYKWSSARFNTDYIGSSLPGVVATYGTYDKYKNEVIDAANSGSDLSSAISPSSIYAVLSYGEEGTGVYFVPVKVSVKDNLAKTFESLSAAETYFASNPDEKFNGAEFYIKGSDTGDENDSQLNNCLYMYVYTNKKQGTTIYDSSANKLYEFYGVDSLTIYDIPFTGRLEIEDGKAKIYQYDEKWAGYDEEGDADDFVGYNNYHEVDWMNYFTEIISRPQKVYTDSLYNSFSFDDKEKDSSGRYSTIPERIIKDLVQKTAGCFSYGEQNGKSDSYPEGILTFINRCFSTSMYDSIANFMCDYYDYVICGITDPSKYTEGSSKYVLAERYSSIVASEANYSNEMKTAYNGLSDLVLNFIKQKKYSVDLNGSTYHFINSLTETIENLLKLESFDSKSVTSTQMIMQALIDANRYINTARDLYKCGIIYGDGLVLANDGSYLNVSLENYVSGIDVVSKITAANAGNVLANARADLKNFEKYTFSLLFEGSWTLQYSLSYELSSNEYGENAYGEFPSIYMHFLYILSSMQSNADDFLKSYYYRELLARYREKFIDDDTSKMKTSDSNKFGASPKLTEQYNGKSGTYKLPTTLQTSVHSEGKEIVPIKVPFYYMDYSISRLEDSSYNVSFKIYIKKGDFFKSTGINPNLLLSQISAYISADGDGTGAKTSKAIEESFKKVVACIKPMMFLTSANRSSFTNGYPFGDLSGFTANYLKDFQSERSDITVGIVSENSNLKNLLARFEAANSPADVIRSYGNFSAYEKMFDDAVKYITLEFSSASDVGYTKKYSLAESTDSEIISIVDNKPVMGTVVYSNLTPEYMDNYVSVPKSKDWVDSDDCAASSKYTDKTEYVSFGNDKQVDIEITNEYFAEDGTDKDAEHYNKYITVRNKSAGGEISVAVANADGSYPVDSSGNNITEETKKDYAGEIFGNNGRIFFITSDIKYANISSLTLMFDILYQKLALIKTYVFYFVSKRTEYIMRAFSQSDKKIVNTFGKAVERISRVMITEDKKIKYEIADAYEYIMRNMRTGNKKIANTFGDFTEYTARFLTGKAMAVKYSAAINEMISRYFGNSDTGIAYKIAEKLLSTVSVLKTEVFGIYYALKNADNYFFRSLTEKNKFVNCIIGGGTELESTTASSPLYAVEDLYRQYKVCTPASLSYYETSASYPILSSVFEVSTDSYFDKDSTYYYYKDTPGIIKIDSSKFTPSSIRLYTPSMFVQGVMLVKNENYFEKNTDGIYSLVNPITRGYYTLSGTDTYTACSSSAAGEHFISGTNYYQKSSDGTFSQVSIDYTKLYIAITWVLASSNDFTNTFIKARDVYEPVSLPALGIVDSSGASHLYSELVDLDNVSSYYYKKYYFELTNLEGYYYLEKKVSLVNEKFTTSYSYNPIASGKGIDSLENKYADGTVVFDYNGYIYTFVSSPSKSEELKYSINPKELYVYNTKPASDDETLNISSDTSVDSSKNYYDIDLSDIYWQNFDVSALMLYRIKRGVEITRK